LRITKTPWMSSFFASVEFGSAGFAAANATLLLLPPCFAAACFAAVAGVVWPEARAVRRSWRGDGIGGFYFTGVIEVERDFIMRSTYERTGFDGAGGFEVVREHL